MPRVSTSIREATLGDIPWIDAMQKKHSRELGFLPTKALEGKVKLGQVLVAEASRDEETKRQRDEVNSESPHSVSSSLGLSVSPPTPVGYLIAADRYFKRDEIGYVTQINVRPEYRRSLVAAQLLQAQFDRSAYGCKLYCLWCAQDLAANEFWENMGFVAIAFRMGSEKKKVASGQWPVVSGQWSVKCSGTRHLRLIWPLTTGHWPLLRRLASTSSGRSGSVRAM